MRKRVRSVALVLAGALAGGLIFSATTILNSARSSLELGMQRLGADIMVAPAGYEAKAQRTLLAGEPTGFYMDSAVLGRVRAVPGVERASPQLFMASAVLECCYAPNVLLVGYDPESDFTIKPWMRFSTTQTASAGNVDTVTLGSNLGYLSSDEVRFYGKQFLIASALHPTGLGFLDMTVFMTMDTARRMIDVSRTISARPLNIGGDQISSIFVKVDLGRNIRKTAADIENAVPGVIAIRTRDLVIAERKNIETALWGVMAAGIAFWIMLLVMMGLVFAMTVNERGRELGIMRAMGATKLHVFRLLMTEAAVLTALGSALGVGIGWGVIYNFKNAIIKTLGNIYFLWPSPLFIISIGCACVLFMLLSGAVSALYPAIRTSGREPYDAIHQGM